MRYGRTILNLCYCLFLIVFCTAARPDCDNRTPDLSCDTDIPVVVVPGACVDLDNPCDESGAWTRVDGLRLCEEPDGLFVQTRRRRSGTTREL